MKLNVRPLDPARQTWEVTDFSLFMYGLVRSDVVEAVRKSALRGLG